MTLRGVDLTVNKATVPNLNDKFGWISGALDETDDRLQIVEALLNGADASFIITGILIKARGGTGADLSATGGAGMVLKQLLAGGAITVATLAASELSNGVTGSGKVMLQASPQTTGNLAVGAAGSFGGGSVVIFIANATAAPGTNPTGGGILYGNAGALTYRGSAGTVTVIAPA